MPLGFHKDSLLNLADLAAAKEEEEKKKEIQSTKKRQQQSAGISSNEPRGGYSLPRSSSFGNEKQRDDLQPAQDEGYDAVGMNWDTVAPPDTTLIRVTSDASNPAEHDLDVDLSDTASESETNLAPRYEDPTNRARPAMWIHPSSSSDGVAEKAPTYGGTDLNDYYDPYASTVMQQTKSITTAKRNNVNNCFCLFAPWGASGHNTGPLDDSDMDDDSASSGLNSASKEATQATSDNGVNAPKSAESGENSSAKKEDEGKTQGEISATSETSSTTPQRTRQYLTAKRDSSSPRERLLRKTIEQVQKLHATEQQQGKVLFAPPPAAPSSPPRIGTRLSSGTLRTVPPSATCCPPEKPSLKMYLIPDSSSNHGNNSSPNARSSQQGKTAGRRSIFNKSGAGAASSTTDVLLNMSSTRSLLSHSSHGVAGGVTASGVRKSCRFAPTARVATIPSRNSMSSFDRSLIWWTRADYDSFKKTGRMIARAMLEGGSDIWLQSQFTREEKKKFDQDEISEESLNTNGGGAADSSNNNNGNDTNYGEKWWCKFGHSRRGLEHIANMEEGRLRQQSVQNAMDTVMKEQRKQKIASGGQINDPGKLARIYQQYTRWAKELAILAGLGDAEAVRNEFNKHNAPITSRSKMTRTSMYTSYVTRNFNFTSEVEASSRQQGSSCWNPGVLDEHTSTSLLIKLNDEYDMHTMAEEGAAPSTSSKAIRERKEDEQATTQDHAAPEVNENGGGSGSNESSFSEEPIHDAPASHHKCIAKKAAGLGQGENDLDRFLEKRFEKKVPPVH